MHLPHRMLRRTDSAPPAAGNSASTPANPSGSNQVSASRNSNHRPAAACAP